MCHFTAICVSMVPGVPRRWSPDPVQNTDASLFQKLVRTAGSIQLCIQAASTDTFQACFLFVQVISRAVGEGVAVGAVACHKELRSVSRQRDPVNSTARPSFLLVETSWKNRECCAIQSTANHQVLKRSLRRFSGS